MTGNLVQSCKYWNLPWTQCSIPYYHSNCKHVNIISAFIWRTQAIHKTYAV